MFPDKWTVGLLHCSSRQGWPGSCQTFDGFIDKGKRFRTFSFYSTHRPDRPTVAKAKRKIKVSLYQGGGAEVFRLLHVRWVAALVGWFTSARRYAISFIVQSISSKLCHIRFVLFWRILAFPVLANRPAV